MPKEALVQLKANLWLMQPVTWLARIETTSAIESRRAPECRSNYLAAFTMNLGKDPSRMKAFGDAVRSAL